MQRTDLNPQIINLLTNDFQMVEQGKYLRGRCPQCDKKSLWTWLDNPGNVQCDRTNKCNYSEPTKDLFPELFEKLNEKYQPTQENPHATADAYLTLIRGFDISQIQGWYEQGAYYHPRGNKGTASVRFYLDEAKQFMWERLIDDVIITDESGDTESRNKSFKGSFKGHWWQPPTLTINKGDEVWLVEGILDAIALNINGIKAVAIMSSGTFPDVSLKPHLRNDITWAIATDNDVAGRKALDKHSKTLRDMGENVTAALSSSNEAKSDWNDLHQAGKLSEKDIHFYRYLGRLELAQSYTEKAQMMWEHNTNRNYFIFAFRNRTYAAKMDKELYEKAYKAYWGGVARVDSHQMSDEDLKEILKEASNEERLKANEYAANQGIKLREIATFSMNYLYFQQPDNGEDGQYFFSFKLANHGQERQIAFTHKTISAASDFKKSSMRLPGALFTGIQQDLDWLYQEWTRFNTKEVRTLDFVGFDRATQSYVFNDYAVEGSRVHKLNSQSFFQLKKEGIKTTVDIKQKLSEKHNATWVPDFKAAFGTKGLVALSWWFGSLFVGQIRQQHRSYPFLQIAGEADSGKSLLIDVLWGLLGKEGESFNPAASTSAGRVRKMAEVSNLPVCFNETDNEVEKNTHQKQFNWNELKDLFEGEFGKVTGIKSQDNSTRKPEFKGALAWTQNVKIVASEAMQTRLIDLWFDTSHHSPAGYQASQRLNAIKVEEVNGFIINAVKQADRVLKHFNSQFDRHRLHLISTGKIKTNRIIENHAKIMALANCLHGLYPEIGEDDLQKTHVMLEQMAIERQASLNEDSELVQQFWAQFDYLDKRLDLEKTQTPMIHQMNHSNRPDDEIAVNLEDFYIACKKRDLPLIDPKELRRNIHTSKKHEYVSNGPVTSRLTRKSKRCWVFKR
tara:strand:+ start:75189 stop:77897 length:2709 start_codon:yes stop_codon:yes gene_type:complete